MRRPERMLTERQWRRIAPLLPNPGPKPGEGRASLGGQSRDARRDFVGAEDWRPVAGLAAAVSQPVHLLASTGPVGGVRRLGAGVAILSPAGRTAATSALGGVFHRWVVRLGERGGDKVGPTKRGKGSKWMIVVDGNGTPMGFHLDSASPGEITLLPAVLATIRVPRSGRGHPRTRPERLIGDKAYDSDPAREALARRGIRLIAPHRNSRTRRRSQDGRPLRRYRRRWTVDPRLRAGAGWAAFAASSCGMNAMP